MTNLWPKKFTEEEKEAPVTILTQQASELYDMTKGTLGAKVDSKYFHERMIHSLKIVAHLMDGYEYELLEIRHDIEMYPVKIKYWNEEGILYKEAKNSEEFKEALKEIFSSEETNRVISALLTQSK